MNTVTVATFNEVGHAATLKNRLEAENIPAEISDESKMERIWFVKKPLAHIRVKVPTDQYERSMQLLTQWHVLDGALRNAVRCPECGSSRVEYPQFTRKFFLPNILGLVSAMGLIEKEFFCTECQYTWPQKGRKLSKARPHEAPNYFIEGIPQAHQK